jgi:hypothetical protein
VLRGDELAGMMLKDCVDPLERLDGLSRTKAEPVSLPVTSVVLETRPEMMGRIRRITEWHRRWFRFQREVVVSCQDPGIPGVFFVNCGTPPPVHVMSSWYSDMCVRWLSKVCDSPFVLVWQWDGFVLDPSAWTGDFMEWDYVGAPVWSTHWLMSAAKMNVMVPKWENPLADCELPYVGNGGFSLRSRRFVEACSRLGDPVEPTMAMVEDMYLCIEKRRELEGQGLRFAPAELAGKFARLDEWDERGLDGCFGFHGVKLLGDVKALLEARHAGRE